MYITPWCHCFARALCKNYGWLNSVSHPSVDSSQFYSIGRPGFLTLIKTRILVLSLNARPCFTPRYSFPPAASRGWWIWTLSRRLIWRCADKLCLCPHRCDGGVLRVRCGGVPRLPDVAHHRGTDAGVLGERQNWGAPLPTSPVGHAASSQARMQRQTATGAVPTPSNTTLLGVHNAMRQ